MIADTVNLFKVGKAMSNNNKAIMSSEDKRLQATTEALQNMKTIKEICILNLDFIFLKQSF